MQGIPTSMRALYIHGLESNGLTQEKSDLLAPLDLSIIAKVYPFKRDKELLADIEQDIFENMPNFLIGSSLGGGLAFYLSNKHNLPALLFNPALHFTRLQQYQNIPSVYLKYPKNKLQHVVFGEFDDIITPGTTIDFLSKNYPEDKLDYEIVIGMQHQIPASVFAENILSFIENVMTPDSLQKA